MKHPPQVNDERSTLFVVRSTVPRKCAIDDRCRAAAVRTGHEKRPSSAVPDTIADIPL